MRASSIEKLNRCKIVPFELILRFIEMPEHSFASYGALRRRRSRHGRCIDLVVLHTKMNASVVKKSFSKISPKVAVTFERKRVYLVETYHFWLWIQIYQETCIVRGLPLSISDVHGNDAHGDEGYGSKSPKITHNKITHRRSGLARSKERLPRGSIMIHDSFHS